MNDAETTLDYFLGFLRGDVDGLAEVDLFFEPDLRRRLMANTGASGFWKVRSDLAIRLLSGRIAGGSLR